MGIGDFGINGTGAAYEYTTSSFQGIVILSSVELNEDNVHNANPPSLQLNVVLQFVLDGKTYNFWVQDVAAFWCHCTNLNALTPGTIYAQSYLNNIWNFTSTNSTSLALNTVTGNGSTLEYGSTYYYRDYAANSLPGQNTSLTLPATIELKVTTEINSVGVPEVDFGYYANNGTLLETYDHATFPWAKGATNDGFVVNGSAYAPPYIRHVYSYFDAELVFVGNNSLSQTIYLNGTTRLSLWLEYYSDSLGVYEYVPNAFNFGGDTGEQNAEAKISVLTDGVGELMSVYTARLGHLYSSNTIEFRSSFPLSSKTAWSVEVDGGGLASALTVGGHGSFINVAVPNGTYNFWIYPPSGNWVVTPSTGEVTVNGLTVVTLTFYFEYSVTFTESGLPSGTNWAVTLAGTQQSSTSTSVSFSETNGTYSFTVNPPSGYTASPSSGSVTVSGSNVGESITFTVPPTKYTVKFSESGLPTGDTWSVTLAGSKHSTTGTSISFSESNGTYSYSVAGPSCNPSQGCWIPSPSSGQVTVSGGNVNVGITFTFKHLTPQGGLSTPNQEPPLAAPEMWRE